LGLSTISNGQTNAVGFPAWATIPGFYSLALARDWHFFFAWILVINGAAYVLYSLFSRHLLRDLAPTSAELDGIGTSIVDHVKFKHPTGEAAKRYNVLQKLAYLSVIFVLVPLLIICGWALSPWLNSIIPGWVDILGGRQSARTIHFLAAWLLFLFVAVHVFEVIVSGFWNHMRSMITGRYRIKRLLGEGSKKRVFLAHDSRLERDVADSVTRRRLAGTFLGAWRHGDDPLIITSRRNRNRV
jgi:thiosulfate reductase cytochrome b subunit